MKPAPSRRAGHLVVFSVGLFGLVAQTLLFREFFTVFEGNELSLAAFFCSWLLWVGVGALVARLPWRGIRWVTTRFAFLPLLYLPAYLLQVWLIEHSRALAGVAAYELFPFARVWPTSFLTNAPVSFLTGLLFALACSWFSAVVRLPVARVYITEAAGAFAGGVWVTGLLALGAPGETVFLYTAALVVLAFAVHQFAVQARPSGILALVAVLVGLGSGVDRHWLRARDERAWQRILPGATRDGRFATPQARYLYGRYHDQFNVVAWETVAESVPNTEHASEVLAVLLAQHPEARDVLVLGPGTFSLCKRLTELPQARRVTWLTPDPNYPEHLLRVMPASFRAGAERLDIPGADPRRYLEEHGETYDLVVLNLPDVTTLALNRYYTKEFFELLKTRLAAGGIVGVRVSAGENFMGDELVNVGASVYDTLHAVFAHLALKPGGETWLLASDGNGLSEKPAVLRDRFAAIPGAAKLYPPDGLMSLYLPDRMAFEEAGYREAMRADAHGLLLNTDRHPKALLHSLLFAARRAGGPGAAVWFFHALAARGLTIALGGLLLYALLRLFYTWKNRGRAFGERLPARFLTFDGYALVLLTGAVGMSSNILLMFLYQSAFGSLFLYIGLASALFMLGLSLGSLATERLLLAKKGPPAFLLPVVIPAHGLVLTAMLVLPAAAVPWLFALFFLLTGLLSGAYVPVAAAKLKQAGVSDATAGALVAVNDHLGGALGGVLTGLFLLPLLGSVPAVEVLACCLGINLVPLLTERASAGARWARDRFEAVSRPLGYTFLGVSAFLLWSSLQLHATQAQSVDTLLRAALPALAPEEKPLEQAHPLASGERLTYFTTADQEGTQRGWCFATDRLAPDVVGYGGPVVLAVAADTNGVLRALAPLKSNETPSYLDALHDWLGGLIGRPLFDGKAWDKVDGVSGATLTSTAIIETLRESGAAFAAQVLERGTGETQKAARPALPDKRFVLLVLFAALAVLLRRKPSRPVRWAFLGAVLVLFGLWLNVQYSMAQVFSLLSLRLPAVGWNAPFLLVVGLPLFVLLFGNVYCGYLCPFGALQELVGRLRPARFKTNPDKAVWRYARGIKYLLLFLLVVLFAFTLDPRLAAVDPLVTLFGKHREEMVGALLVLVLALSFFYERFWCRNLCPTGAFLSLLNGVQLLKRFTPVGNYKVCLYGVHGLRDLDCICCDRCRGLKRDELGAITATLRAPASRVRGVVFLVCAALLALLLARETISTWERQRHTATQAVRGTAGVPREVDMKKLEAQLREHRLSEHEAMYYRRAGEVQPPGAGNSAETNNVHTPGRGGLE